MRMSKRTEISRRGLIHYTLLASCNVEGVVIRFHLAQHLYTPTGCNELDPYNQYAGVVGDVL